MSMDYVPGMSHCNHAKTYMDTFINKRSKRAAKGPKNTCHVH